MRRSCGFLFWFTIAAGLFGFCAALLSTSAAELGFQLALGFLTLGCGFAFLVVIHRRRWIHELESLGFASAALPGVACLLAVLLGLWMAEGNSSLWVHDSRFLHLPGIKNTIDFLQGRTLLYIDSVFARQIQVTYFWVAFWFMTFGESPWVSGFAMLVLRVATWGLSYIVVRKSFGVRVAILTVLLMALTPTQIFYAMPLYKDPMVQFLTVLVLTSALRVFESGNPIYLVFALAGLAGLAFERIYVVPTIFCSIFLATLCSPARRFRLQRFVVLAIFGSGGLFAFWRLFKRDFNIMELQNGLIRVRQGFHGYVDVDRTWNLDIPYALAFLKILFTPFFTLNKFSMFTDLSSLITWGSFAQQSVMCLALLGFCSEWKRNKIRTTILVLPLLIFLFLFAYIAPFSGRQRDGYFLIVALFAAVAIDRGLLKRAYDYIVNRYPRLQTSRGQD